MSNHQAIFDTIPTHIRDFLQIHPMWSGVSCIRLAKGAYQPLIEAAKEPLKTKSHSIIFTEVELAVLRVVEAMSPNERHCARRVNNGFVGVFIYLGTANIEDFLAKSQSKKEVTNVQ